MLVASEDQGTFIRLVIADRHPIVLQGLRSAFAAQPDFEIVAWCSSGAGCVEAIRDLAPDVALLADTMLDVTVSEFLAIAKAENLSTRLVFFTQSQADDDLAAAIAIGACSAIPKQASLETLLHSLRLTAERINALPAPSPDLGQAGKDVDGAKIEKMLTVLTDREREIMRLASEGLSNKEIARQLNVSPGTVKAHLYNIFQKLEINNRTALTAIALLQRPAGFGTLSLAILTFATMSDVKASDPNNTFLDDDSIAYKDLEHGAFELWTKEAVPRHIIVEDPAETVVLTQRGSSISVNHVTNSAARMEELQAAQQAALSNFAKGYGPAGSSTPYLFSPPALQPINYTQTGGPTTQGQLPPLEFAPNPIIHPIKPPPPPPTPPSLTPATGPRLVDTPVFDTFAPTSGTFAASSLNSNTLTFGIIGSANGNFVLEGEAYDVAKSGPFGTLYLNSTTGAFGYAPNGDAINALTAPTTVSFTVTVWDGTLSDSQTYTVTIVGVNDPAVIAGATTGAAVEAGGATSGTPFATGTLTSADVDNAANTFIAVTSPTQSHGGYGTFTMTAAGVWTYTLNDANPSVQALNAGGTLTDTFTVASIDGTTQVVTVTVTGSNDPAIISGAASGSVVEAGGVTSGSPVATGTLTDTDVDNAANTFVAVTSPAQSHGGYGTFTMTAAGAWTYTLNDANPTVQALNAGGALTDTFTVASIDGTTQVVTITITGSNDPAVISGAKTGSVVEAGGATSGTPVATGTLTSNDVDNAANAFIAVTSPAQSHGGYGTFTMTAAGVWAYTLNNANPAVQALNVGGTLIDTFSVATVDGTFQLVTITISGTNDAAVISGITSGSVIEAGGATSGTAVATGTLTDTDVDNSANAFIPVVSPTKSLGGYGTFTMTAAGVWLYTLDNSNAAVDALNPGETLTDTFTVATVDGTTQVVTITIHGASDADPNDFDNLALGTAVDDSQPPFVFGTPGHDSVAGGGNSGQIIYGGAGDDTLNGTGVVDVIYGGSGNDTFKGNGGEDTIYGGSGSDTVNGNNGNDTIIGGYGGDQLTGSNGDDVFVYLSAIDSNAAQFDTITDFASGSDKINLAAFGALAFLHLTPASTSVPPHTLAWIYDPTSNETIVYVNPTDGSLDIGDAGLLELHLQGVVSVAESDFVYEADAAAVAAALVGIDPALLVTTASDGTVLTTGSAQASIDAAVSESSPATASIWTMPADDGLRFHFARDRIDSIVSIKLAVFNDDPAYATEASDDGAVAAPVHVSSIELVHSHATALTEEHLTLKEEPVHANTVATTIGHGKAHAAAEVEPSVLGITAQSAAIASAAAMTGEPYDTTGNGGFHGNSQHASNSAAAKAAAADPTDPDTTTGNGNSHGNSQHALNSAAAKATAGPTDPDATTGNGHGNSPHASNPGAAKSAAAAEPDDPTSGNGNGLGHTFHFKNQIASSGQTTAIEPDEHGHIPGPVAHGHGAGALAASLGTDMAALSPTEEPAAIHVNNGQHNAVGHGAHDLLI